jgi:hypothetical protein
MFAEHKARAFWNLKFLLEQEVDNLVLLSNQMVIGQRTRSCTTSSRRKLGTSKGRIMTPGRLSIRMDPRPKWQKN